LTTKYQIQSFLPELTPLVSIVKSCSRPRHRASEPIKQKSGNPSKSVKPILLCYISVALV